MEPVVHGFRGRRVRGAPAGDDDALLAGPVAEQPEAQEPARTLGADRQHGTGVSEQDARVSIGPVEIPAQEVHAHDQDLTVHTAVHEAGPGRQAKHEP